MRLFAVARTLSVVMGVMLLLAVYGAVRPPFTSEPSLSEPVVVTVEATPPRDPRYIVIESLDLTFTEEAYYERVRDQIEQDGWETVCVLHLGTLAREAQYLSVNSARQNLVYVTECATASELAQGASVP